MKIFKNIENVSDKKSLYESLSENSLEIIDSVLEAYNKGEIDIIIPRTDDDEPDFDGEFTLNIVDDTYIETGWELLILKWVNDYEYTDYLIECFE